MDGEGGGGRGRGRAAETKGVEERLQEKGHREGAGPTYGNRE